MNRLSKLRNRRRVAAAAVCTACCVLALTACSDDTTGDDSRLPDGEYPMAFTAAVDGLTATRATGKDAWTKDDQIAVSVDNGASSKKYKITDTGTGAMEPVTTGDGYYWQNKDDKTILAWYPAEDIANKDISDQSSGFAAFDYLTADAKANYTANAVTLLFKHQMAKVKYTLVKGEGISDDDIANATVSISGYQYVSFSKGKVSSTNNENVWITPHADKEALVIPQDMTRKQFIRVTIGKNDAARNYYYTPTAPNDGNLEAGNQYTYTITVKKTGISVESLTGQWVDVEQGSGTASEATFNIHLAAFIPPANTADYKVTDAQGNALTTAGSGIYTTKSNEIRISLSVNSDYLLKDFRPTVTSGICKVAIDYVTDTRTYTYRFYDIRSDLRMENSNASAILSSSLNAPSVGDYYYSDGTWSSGQQNGKTCVGIVFKINAGADDIIGNYNNFFTGEGIRGYVVALNDANSGNLCDWGTRGVDTSIPNVDDTNVTAYTGYSDTKTIIDTYQSADTWGDYAAFSSVVAYRSSVPAPVSSSGWYLPSLAQLGDVYAALASINGNLASVGNAFQTNNDSRYWTSSEKTGGVDSWHVKMNNGAKESYAKNGSNYSRACYVRAILTF